MRLRKLRLVQQRKAHHRVYRIRSFYLYNVTPICGDDSLEQLIHDDSLTEEYNGPLLKGELGEIKSFTLHYDLPLDATDARIIYSQGFVNPDVNPDCITDPKLVEEIERCMIEEDEAARNGSLVHTPLPIKVWK